jgi:hypothetical protein
VSECVAAFDALYDASTGKQLWKTYSIADARYRKV